MVTTPARKAPTLTITPVSGTGSVALNSPVLVKSNAPLASVTVTRSASASQATPAGTLAGQLSADKLTWTSTGGLFADSAYKIVATTAAGPGFTGVATKTSSFSTLTPVNAFKVSWDPVDGQTVGVGEPITLDFNAAVTDRAAVQRRLSVTSTPPVLGAWNWMSDTTVVYRPKAYWPAKAKVHVTADLAGYDAGSGRFGVKDREQTFTIGPAQISYADASTKTMKVYRDGVLQRQFPVSLGREQYPSMEGPHNVLAVAPNVIMDSATVGIPKGNPDYYYETVNWDVQFTSGGEYVHAAPWSVGEQGFVNVSHGCVNASDANAQWFYQFSRIGDIVNVLHTGRPADVTQGGNAWSIPWANWIKGSALPVVAPTTPAPSAGPAVAAGAPGVTAPSPAN